MKKFTLFIKISVFSLLILTNTIFVATGYDIVNFSINNRLISFFPFLLTISIFATLPLIIFKRSATLIAILTLSFFINFLLLLSQYSIEISTIVLLIFLDINSQIIALLLNSLVGLLVSIFMLLYKKQDIIIRLHLFFVLIYFLINTVWYIGVIFPQSNFPNIFISLEYNLVYSIINIFKGTYLYISTMYIIIRYLANEIKVFSKIIPNNLSRYHKLIISVFLGMLGIERLFDYKRKAIFIFQFLTAIFVISYIITIQYFYYNIRFNLPLFVVFIIIISLKITVNIHSAISIIRE